MRPLCSAPAVTGRKRSCGEGMGSGAEAGPPGSVTPWDKDKEYLSQAQGTGPEPGLVAGIMQSKGMNGMASGLRSLAQPWICCVSSGWSLNPSGPPFPRL